MPEGFLTASSDRESLTAEDKLKTSCLPCSIRSTSHFIRLDAELEKSIMVDKSSGASTYVSAQPTHPTDWIEPQPACYQYTA